MSLTNVFEALENKKDVDAMLAIVRDVRARIEQVLPLLDADMVKSLQASLANIVSLEDQLNGGGLKAADLPNMAQLVAAAQAIAVSVESSLPTAAAKETVEQFAARSREQAKAMMQDLRQFDDLLEFSSAEEQTAYHQREEKRRKHYDAEIAKGIPEGDLNATGAALGQATDLAVHGGMKSPAIGRRLGQLSQAATKLREQMIQDGRDVSSFDNELRDDLQAIMRSKGISENRIAALLKAHGDNPVEAVRAFVTEYHASVTAKDIEQLDTTVKEGLEPPQPEAKPEPAKSPPSSKGLLVGSLNNVAAELRALGIDLSEHDIATPPSHGVNANALGLKQASTLLT